MEGADDDMFLIARLQYALSQQEEEAQRKAALQAQQMESMARKLQQAESQIRLLQDERDENIIALGNAAAAELHLDHERADLQRIKAELLKQHEDIRAARSYFAAQQREELEHARQLARQGGELDPAERASFQSALHDFEAIARELEAVLRSRAAYRHGAAVRSAGAGEAGACIGMDEAGGAEVTDAALLHLLQVQQQVQQTQQLLEPEFRLQGGAGKPPSVAPLVLALHLRMQQSMMLRLMHHLATEGEADAARVLAREADVRELQDKLVEKQAQIAELSLEVSKMPEWEVKTAALISEVAEVRELLRASKAKYKERLAAVGSQNKVLRQQLLQKHEACQQLEGGQQAEAARSQALDAELHASKEQAQAAGRQLAALNEHCQQLQLSLTQQSKRAEALEFQLHEARSQAGCSAAEAQADRQGLQGRIQQLELECEAQLAQTQARDIQLAEQHAGMQAQLLAVREAYAEELRALYDQVARAEAHTGPGSPGRLRASCALPPMSPAYLGASPGGYMLLQQQLQEARQQSIALEEQVAWLKAQQQLSMHRLQQQQQQQQQLAAHQVHREQQKQQQELIAQQVQREQRLQQQQQQQEVLAKQLQREQQQQQAGHPFPPEAGSPSTDLHPSARQHHYQQQVQMAWEVDHHAHACAPVPLTGPALGPGAAPVAAATAAGGPDAWTLGRLEALSRSVHTQLGTPAASTVGPLPGGGVLWQPAWEHARARQDASSDEEQPSWQDVLSRKQTGPGGSFQEAAAAAAAAAASWPHLPHGRARQRQGPGLDSEDVRQKREEGLRRYHGQEHAKLKQAYQGLRQQQQQQHRYPAALSPAGQGEAWQQGPEAAQCPHSSQPGNHPNAQKGCEMLPSRSPSPSSSSSSISPPLAGQPPTRASSSSSHASSSRVPPTPPSPPSPSSSSHWSQHDGPALSQPQCHAPSSSSDEPPSFHQGQAGFVESADDRGFGFAGPPSQYASSSSSFEEPRSQVASVEGSEPPLQMPSGTHHAGAQLQGPRAGLPPRPSTARTPPSMGWVGQPPSSLAVPLTATQRHSGQLRAAAAAKPATPTAAEQGGSRKVTSAARPKAGLATAQQPRPMDTQQQQQQQQQLQQQAAAASPSRPASAEGSNRQTATAAAAHAAAAIAGVATAGQARGAGRGGGPCTPEQQGRATGTYEGAEAERGVAHAQQGGGRGRQDDCPGLAVPEEVLRMAQQFSGSEGVVRPRTALPSAMQVTSGASQELPVPPEVLQLLSQYMGHEGGIRPPTATPSVMRPPSQPTHAEAPVPPPLLHLVGQSHAREGEGRPSSAPSSDRQQRAGARADTTAPATAYHLPSDLSHGTLIELDNSSSSEAGMLDAQDLMLRTSFHGS